MRWTVLSMAAALVLSGCSAPLASNGRFAFEVTNTGTAPAAGTGNATSGTEVTSKDFQVPPGQAVRVALDPPTSRFNFSALVRPAGGGPSATTSGPVDLTVCAGVTIYRFEASASPGSVRVGVAETRCEG